MTLRSPIQRVSKTHEVVCVIPTLNESTTVAEVITYAKRFAHRVVVVDGYSSDDTTDIARKAGADVLLQAGRGKGMALRTVFDQIDGDVYVIIDGDATYDPREAGKVLRPILTGEADMVIGSRLRGKMEAGSITPLHRIGNHFFNLLINRLYRGAITDSQSGFRALNRDTVDRLRLSSIGFEVETEMTVKALKHGLTIAEVPITYAKRRGSPSKLHSVRAGATILKTIINPSR